jgi:WD40 repeat protein
VLALTSVATPGRRLLATGGHDATVRLWDPATHTPLHDPLIGHTGPVLAAVALAVGPRRFMLVTGGRDRKVALWDPATGFLRHLMPIGFAVYGLTTLGADLVVAGEDGVVTVRPGAALLRS